MADYKRLVSYIYNYESGIRKRNVGFSRVESKNGQCKVTIHITANVTPVDPLKVYLYHRSGRRMEGVLFGEMTLKNGTGDFRGETSTASLMNTEYSLDDICGVLIFLNKNKFFGSQWDDQEIRIDDFSEYSERKRKDREEEFVRDIKVQPQDETDMQMEEELAKQLMESSEPEELIASQLEETMHVDDAMETVVTSVQSIFGQEQESEESYDESLEEVLATQVEEPEVNENEVQASEVESQSVEKTQASEKEELYASQAEILEEKQEDAGQVKASSLDGSCCGSKNYPECVRRVLKSFPSVKPFPESIPENWVRIEPKDIGMLPVETWVLANNSFLLHGYYNYRHLVFGILKLEEGEQFVIGVPGVLQTTEQTMAGMFGFHRFVSTNEGEGKYGSFGYWIQQIVL